MDSPTACTALSMFYHRVRCAVQAFGLHSLFKVQRRPVYGSVFRSFRHARELAVSVCVPLTVLIVPQGFPLVKCFFQNFLNFFRLPCGLSCVVLWSISDYRITQGCKLVKYFFQKIRKKIGGKNLLYFFS